MCGIVATLDPRPGGPSPDAMRRAVTSLHHRGPDRRSILFQGPVAPGHTRLAIVDVRHGDQPFLRAVGAGAAEPLELSGQVVDHAVQLDLDVTQPRSLVGHIVRPGWCLQNCRKRRPSSTGCLPGKPHLF